MVKKVMSPCLCVVGMGFGEGCLWVDGGGGGRVINFSPVGFG